MTTLYASINFVLRHRQTASAFYEARIGSKLSQADVGALLGRSATWVARLEHAEAEAWHTLSMADYVAICNLLDLNPASFFELEIP